MFYLSSDLISIPAPGLIPLQSVQPVEVKGGKKTLFTPVYVFTCAFHTTHYLGLMDAHHLTSSRRCQIPACRARERHLLSNIHVWYFSLRKLFPPTIITAGNMNFIVRSWITSTFCDYGLAVHLSTIFSALSEWLRGL